MCNPASEKTQRFQKRFKVTIVYLTCIVIEIFGNVENVQTKDFGKSLNEFLSVFLISKDFCIMNNVPNNKRYIFQQQELLSISSFMKPLYY